MARVPTDGAGPAREPGGSRWLLPCAALREVLREGYGLAALRADVAAGLVVGVVALPLSMALAIATGLPPQHGLYTAIVAGGLIALLGGSRVQVSGPTAAFVVVLSPLVTQYGPGGLMVATALAGVLLMALGVLRLGRLIQFVPYPVTTGFTAGIAVVIAGSQLGTLLGLEGMVRRDHAHEMVGEVLRCLGTLDPFDLGMGLLTLALLVWVPRLTTRVPAPLVAIGTATLLAWALERTGVDAVRTIADQFSYVQDGAVQRGIPPWPPQWGLPWEFVGADGARLDLSWDTLKALLKSALAIAMLGAIESLLSAVAADAMNGRRHDPDAELLAQGTGNLVAPFFGGFAATGAIARTATNVRAGARSPVAALVHVAFLLLAMVLFAPVLGRLPMSALAALLLATAWRMADAPHLVRVVRTAPRGDVVVLLACLGLTVAFDMVVGVMAGTALAGLLFLRRMSELSGMQLLRPTPGTHDFAIPPGVLVYEVEGPLFFGAAERAMSALHSIGDRGMVVVLDLDGVPVMDATGLVNLQSALQKLRADRVPVVLGSVRDAVRETLDRAEVRPDGAMLHERATLREAVVLAGELAAARARA